MQALDGEIRTVLPTVPVMAVTGLTMMAMRVMKRLRTLVFYRLAGLSAEDLHHLLLVLSLDLGVAERK